MATETATQPAKTDAERKAEYAAQVARHQAPRHWTQMSQNELAQRLWDRPATGMTA